MISHAKARTYALAGFRQRLGEPKGPQVQILQCVALHESSYGAGWRGAGKGSWNMGAIQAGRPPCNTAGAFEYTDTHPTKGGGLIPYRICFRKYQDAAAGFAGLAATLYARRPSVLEAASAVHFDIFYKVASAMWRTGYYEGFGATKAIRISNYAIALKHAGAAIARALDEPMPNGEPAPRRTLRVGAHGDDVKVVQAALGITVDGLFGPITKSAVAHFQSAAVGLAVDGIVGAQTWSALDALSKQT